MPRRKARKKIGDIAELRAVIYLRVSTQMQVDEGYGLDAQLDNCNAYAEKRGYKVVEIKKDEAISGTKGLEFRKGLDEALKLCQNKEVDIFLCSALDRQSRDNELFFYARKELKRVGVPFVTVKEDLDFTKKKNALMGDIFAAFAAEERRRIAGRLLDGRTQRSKADGRGSGYTPYGYTATDDDEVVADETEARTVRTILSMRDAGDSYQRIATYLNDQGIKSPKGLLWLRSSVQHINAHRPLYMTGLRSWSYLDDEEENINTIDAKLQWPIIYTPEPRKDS